MTQLYSAYTGGEGQSQVKVNTYVMLNTMLGKTRNVYWLETEIDIQGSFESSLGTILKMIQMNKNLKIGSFEVMFLMTCFSQ